MELTYEILMFQPFKGHRCHLEGEGGIEEIQTPHFSSVILLCTLSLQILQVKIKIQAYKLVIHYSAGVSLLYSENACAIYSHVTKGKPLAAHTVRTVSTEDI